MNSDGTKELLDTVTAGKDAIVLATTPGFIRIMEMLEADMKSASIALHSVDAEDTKEIRKLQNIIWRYEELTDKLSQLIEAGSMAAEELNQ